MAQPRFPGPLARQGTAFREVSAILNSMDHLVLRFRTTEPGWQASQIVRDLDSGSFSRTAKTRTDSLLEQKKISGIALPK